MELLGLKAGSEIRARVSVPADWEKKLKKEEVLFSLGELPDEPLTTELAVFFLACVSEGLSIRLVREEKENVGESETDI